MLILALFLESSLYLVLCLILGMIQTFGEENTVLVKLIWSHT